MADAAADKRGDDAELQNSEFRSLLAIPVGPEWA